MDKKKELAKLKKQNKIYEDEKKILNQLAQEKLKLRRNENPLLSGLVNFVRGLFK